MANMVEQGATPVLNPEHLARIGYKIAAYPLTLILAAIKAMEDALSSLMIGGQPGTAASFEHLREIVGFPEYYQAEKRYAWENFTDIAKGTKAKP